MRESDFLFPLIVLPNETLALGIPGGGGGGGRIESAFQGKGEKKKRAPARNTVCPSLLSLYSYSVCRSS